MPLSRTLIVGCTLMMLGACIVWLRPWNTLLATETPACKQLNEAGKVGVDSCCRGLQAENTGNVYQKEYGKCSRGNSFKFICTQCGNGTCDRGENQCTCAKDCAPGCGKEGETIDRFGSCCSGLQPENTGNRYIKATKSCSHGVSAKYICTKCGNKVCDSGESYCTCPKDCEIPQPPCVTLGTRGKEGVNECCTGLKPQNTGFKYDRVTKQCVKENGYSFICTNCGDGTCDRGENRCTCAKDCAP